MSFRISPGASSALARGEAVVALESTVITHGLPRPENLGLARELEETVRAAGALPATVGVIGGELVVGLEEDELEHLAGADADKASLWNLSALLASGRDAGTTVATTLYAAHRAGISVFATGGLGGVHPEQGEQAFDESADLAALARYPLLVVCSGAKSILDVAATLERLESLGVAVLGYRSDRLAGFYSPETRLAVAARADTPAQVARHYRMQAELGLTASVVVSKPVSAGLAEAELAAWLAQARQEAREAGVRGKRLTPFLLSRLAELSGGRSLEVNLRLLKENARLAAELALALGARMDGAAGQSAASTVGHERVNHERVNHERAGPERVSPERVRDG
jgi:pseudouridine-5'-phosphate glycosidase